MYNRIRKKIFLFMMPFSFFLILFALLSTVQLKLATTNGQVVYFNYSFQYPAHNLILSQGETQYKLQNIIIYNVVGSQTINLTQNVKTTLPDILSPTKGILSPIQITENDGQQVSSDYLLSFLFVIIGSAFYLLLHMVLSSGILFKKFSLLKSNCNHDSVPCNERSSMNPSLRLLPILFKLLLFFLGGKLIYFIVYYVLLKNSIISNDLIKNITPWDSGYYRSIIYGGYDLVRHPWDGQANWAFFPVFPILGQFLLYVFDSEYAIIIFNQVLLFISLLMLYKYIITNYDRRTAIVAVLFLSIGSENIYFASLYTESLFLFLSLATLLLLDKSKYISAALICGILSGVRMQGLLMSIIVVYHYFSFNKFKLSFDVILKLLMILFLSSIGFLAFILYLQLHVGDGLAFYHIQSSFGRSNVSWFNLIGSIGSLWHGGTGVDRVLSIISIPIIIYFYYQRRYCELLFFTLCFLIEIASKSLQSYSRFFFANYATYIFLGAYAKDVFRLTFTTVVILVLSVTFIYLWLISSSYVW